jgi:hypothetical protein
MRGTMKLAFLGLCVCAGAASWARGRKDEAVDAARAAADRGPAASASEIPALANLLAKAGWTPTPELSGVFKAGSIFETTAIGHRPLATNCFAAQPEESTYTAADIVTSLQAGVSVGGPLASGGAYAGIVKKVKFGTPTQVSIPGMDLELSKSCEEKLKRLPMSRIQSSYVVQEVLKAEISEQTCGKVDARGSFVGLGSAEAEYAAACAQSSLEPVAVGYRTVPLAELLHLNVAESGPVRSGDAAGWSSVRGGGFDASGTMARIQAAKDEEVRLNSELDACLDAEEQNLLSRASADASGIAPLLKDTSAKARELGAADVKRYIDLYGSAEVKCTNDLGERRRSVSISALDGMRSWLEAPASGGAVASYTASSRRSPSGGSAPPPTDGPVISAGSGAQGLADPFAIVQVGPGDRGPRGIVHCKDDDVRTMVKAVVERFGSQLNQCYNTALNTKDDLRGRWKVMFNLQTDGKPGPVKVVAQKVSDAGFEDCLKRTVQNWEFEPICQPVDLNLPFNFGPK